MSQVKMVCGGEYVEFRLGCVEFEIPDDLLVGTLDSLMVVNDLFNLKYFFPP